MSLDLIIVPDAEKLLVDFLLAQEEITDFFTSGVDDAGNAIVTPPEDRVFTEMPKKTKIFPLIRVHQYNAIQVTSRSLWLTRYSLQVDVFGGPKQTAHDLAVTCMAVMSSRLPGLHDQGIVTGVDIAGLRPEPDDTYTPPRPRTIFTATIYARPNQAGGS